ncbi:cytochrome P450 [Durotheca rogersii]|uniref:cytochrome P450 n=1 Tax=Durotheca rogersii TaxID=419775 RepID=UPI00222050DE|nr:cytochrome P450 [Durotheca rogersii]KAI5868134.1 cytochrome P450 [Durotheca rogersii]
MCFGATCSTCSKKSWRGCGSHVPAALAGVPEDKWCTCGPRVTIEGKQYPPAAKMSMPGLSWLTSMFGGGGGSVARRSSRPAPYLFIYLYSNRSSDMLLLNPLVLGGVCAVLALLYVWRCVTSPLRVLPGPTVSLFSSWMLKYHELRAHRTQYVHGLHLRYGPVVRIAPNEVSFASAEGIKEIYGSGGSGYDKTEFYDLFKIYGRRTTFTTLNKEDHARRKRIIADRYANSNILKPESLGGIKERSKRFIERCSKSVGGSIDIFVTLDDSLQNRLIQHYSPVLHGVIGSVLSLFSKPRQTPLADDLVLSASAKASAAPFTLLSRLQSAGVGAGGLAHLDVAAECLDHMAAGIDTTGDALCFLMWELSQPRSRAVQQRLQAELRAGAELALDRLPFLDAVVCEGLRCFPAIPMSLPRRVPAGGRAIDGRFVPAGAVVSCQAYSAHRIDAAVFPDPDAFDPDRWLREPGDLDRKRLFFAFASGGRGCIGKHLALAEMKVLLRDVYSRFTTLPDPSMTARDMEMADQLISSQPRGRKCLLRLIPLDQGPEGGVEDRPGC